MYRLSLSAVDGVGFGVLGGNMDGWCTPKRGVLSLPKDPRGGAERRAVCGAPGGGVGVDEM